MKKIITIIFISLFTGCQTNKNNTDFLNYFIEVKQSELIDNFLVPKAISINKTYQVNDTNSEILNYFLIPVNEVDYKLNYLPTKRDTYTLLYKYKLNTNYYMISYIHEWGHLTEYSQYVCIYNVEKDKIQSVLNISTPNGAKRIVNASYDGEYISIKVVYDNNLEEGLDPVKNSPKEITEKYIINKDFVFQKVR